MRRCNANQTLETNRRPASPLGASRPFERAVHAQACLSGGGRSAWRLIWPLDHTMTSDTQMIGFEKDSELGGLFAQFEVFQDYRATLPEHLLGILRQQHPSVIIESVELLDAPKYNLGGMQQPDSETLVRVQTLRVPLDLRLTLRVGAGRFGLDVQLVIICEGLDSTPTVRSDMFIKTQREIA
jgi:hypothetical protein